MSAPFSFRRGSLHSPGNEARPHLPLALGAIVLCCVVAGTTVAWRMGHPQRAFRILWEGDKEGRARVRQLKNVSSARDYINDLADEVEVMLSLLDRDAQTMGRQASQSQYAKLGVSLSKSVTDVLVHLDKVTGDDQVRTARRQQVDRALALGARIRSAVGDAAANQ